MRVRFRLLVAVSVFSSVGCASIAGLNDLKEVPCAGDECEGEDAGTGGSAVGGTAGAAGGGGKAGASGGKAGAAGSGGLAGGGSGGASGGAAGAAGLAGSAGNAGFGGVFVGGSAGTAGQSGGGGASGSGTCIPKTCAELGAECGEPPDGCGGTAKCSTCADPKLTCGVTTASGNIPFVCGCKPNTYKCDGASLFQCTSDGQAYLLAATCDSVGACNAGTQPSGGAGGAAGAAGAGGATGGSGGATGGAAGASAGVPGSCTPCTAGAALCQGLQPFTCSGGSFVKKGNACPAGDTGAGVCDPSNGGTCRTCAPNAFSCAGPKLQQCDATGSSLTDKATCASGALCAKSVFTGTCVAPICQAGERRCAGDTSQICGPNRDQFINDVKCESAALCTNGSCAAPACAIGETKCAGSTLQKCKADRTGFEKDKDCAAPSPACDLVNGKAACTVRGPELAILESAFAYIHSTEVTNGDYNKFLAAGVSPSTQPAVCSWNADFGSTVMPVNLPRTDVDWCDAKAYCAWAGMQLCGRIGALDTPVPPSEALDATIDQWTAFCVGPSKSAYPYGDVYDPKKCNGPVDPPNPAPAAVPVRSNLQCSTSGIGIIYDMIGNVAEWENSCVDYTSPTDACNIRGGSYLTEGSEVGKNSMKCTANAPPPARNVKRPDIGFRCCVQ